jgi:hypothetical protein
METRDLLAHAAECERALQVATETEHRDMRRQLRKAWLDLADEQSIARAPDWQEELAALRRLHTNLTAVQATLH